MHEIVANQLWADDPPEVWQTATRLLAAGYERHEVLHMLASVVSDDVYESCTTRKHRIPTKTRAALPRSRARGNVNAPSSRPSSTRTVPNAARPPEHDDIAASPNTCRAGPSPDLA